MYCTWRSLTDFSPVLILAFQLVLEMNLLRRDQAQRGVVDPESRTLRGQAHPFA